MFLVYGSAGAERISRLSGENSVMQLVATKYASGTWRTGVPGTVAVSCVAVSVVVSCGMHTSWQSLRTFSSGAVSMHLAPLGRELQGVHMWSDCNTLAGLGSPSHVTRPSSCCDREGTRMTLLGHLEFRGDTKHSHGPRYPVWTNADGRQRCTVGFAFLNMGVLLQGVARTRLYTNRARTEVGAGESGKKLFHMGVETEDAMPPAHGTTASMQGADVALRRCAFDPRRKLWWRHARSWNPRLLS